MAKSPFAVTEIETYDYPAPLDATEVDGETVSPLTIEANEARIDHDEVGEGHWIKIRIPRSRGDVDAVADATQSMTVLGDDGMKFEQRIAIGNRRVFELLVEKWSFDVPATGENYSKLGDWAGDWISAVLGDVVRRGTKRDFAKKTPDSSSPPEPSEETASSPEAKEADSKS